MAESEETTQGGATSSGAGAKTRRTSRRQTTGGRTSRKKATGGRAAGSARKRSTRKRAATRSQKNALAGLLGTLQKRAADASSRLAELSGEGAVAAKKAVGTITTSSRRTIQGVKREWKRMDTPAKVKFVAALLATLAAASGTVVASRRRK